MNTRAGVRREFLAHLFDEGEQRAVLGGEMSRAEILAGIALRGCLRLPHEIPGPPRILQQPRGDEQHRQHGGQGRRAPPESRAGRTSASAASATAAASSTGSGRSCTSAPPVMPLIEVPVNPSNASHSRRRSPAISTAPIGFATTPRMRTGCGNGPRIVSARPVIRPTQSGFDASDVGSSRPDATVIGVELIFAGA